MVDLRTVNLFGIASRGGYLLVVHQRNHTQLAARYQLEPLPGTPIPGASYGIYRVRSQESEVRIQGSSPLLNPDF